MATLATTGDDINAEIRGIWTNGAAEYDQDPGHGLLTPAVEDAWLRLLEAVLGPRPKTLLDAGAGTGFLSVLAAKSGHRVTAIDLTPAMLDRARERARVAGVDVEFVEGDAAATEFESNHFDGVISRHLLWTLPDPEAAFREWIRVTRAGGEVAWFDTLQQPATPVRRLRAAAARVAERAGRQTEDGSVHDYDDELAALLPFRDLENTAPVREMLARIGVSDVSCRATPGISRAERGSMGLRSRMSPGPLAYAGRFPVTIELKTALSG
jgi:ubiquinone/menaquinone biosynthesis C-methylase UbiE